MFFANTDANRIYTLEVPGRTGVIGMSACPGIRMESAKRGNTQRNLKRDIAAYREWGATGVVTLNEAPELQEIGLGDLGEQLVAAGFWWRHLPIIDMNVPDTAFENAWQVEGQQLIGSLAAGERIIIHCLAGLGRTGMISARLLVDTGIAPERAVTEVRKVRPRAIQTTAQEEYVHLSARKTRHDRWSRLQDRKQQAEDSEQGLALRNPLKGFGT